MQPSERYLPPCLGWTRAPLANVWRSNPLQHRSSWYPSTPLTASDVTQVTDHRVPWGKVKGLGLLDMSLHNVSHLQLKRSWKHQFYTSGRWSLSVRCVLYCYIVKNRLKTAKKISSRISVVWIFLCLEQSSLCSIKLQLELTVPFAMLRCAVRIVCDETRIKSSLQKGFKICLQDCSYFSWRTFRKSWAQWTRNNRCHEFRCGWERNFDQILLAYNYHYPTKNWVSYLG